MPKGTVRRTKSTKHGSRFEEITRGLIRPTRKGKSLRSSWLSRTHGRISADPRSRLLCQSSSRTKLWKRDLVSVPPGEEAKITCGRCLRVVDAASASAPTSAAAK